MTNTVQYTMTEEIIPEWAKKMQSCIGGSTTNITGLHQKIDELPLKIKQALLPQLIIEVRNCVKSELEKKF